MKPKTTRKRVKGGQGANIGLHMSHYFPHNQTGGLQPPLPGGNDTIQYGGKKRRRRRTTKKRKSHKKKSMKGGFGPVGNLGTGSALMFGNSHSAGTSASILAGQPYVSSDVVHQHV